MQPKLLPTAAVLAVAILGLSGCGSSNDSPAAGQGTTTMTHSAKVTHPTKAPATKPSASTPATSSGDAMAGMVMIDIKNFMYVGNMSVKPGQQVMVTNDDPEAHTLTSDQTGMFAVTVQAGATATFDAPTKPGSYAYHCDFHSNMHGTLVVA